MKFLKTVLSLYFQSIVLLIQYLRIFFMIFRRGTFLVYGDRAAISKLAGRRLLSIFKSSNWSTERRLSPSVPCRVLVTISDTGQLLIAFVPGFTAAQNNLVPMNFIFFKKIVNISCIQKFKGILY